jgi:hypothetical protein
MDRARLTSPNSAARPQHHASIEGGRGIVSRDDAGLRQARVLIRSYDLALGNRSLQRTPGVQMGASEEARSLAQARRSGSLTGIAERPEIDVVSMAISATDLGDPAIWNKADLE